MLRIFRRKPKPELGPERTREPEHTVMPCGERVYFRPTYSETSWDYEYMRDIARHKATCAKCNALVSHPDFDQEWTA